MTNKGLRRRQVFIGTNDVQVYWYIFATFGLRGLSCCNYKPVWDAMICRFVPVYEYASVPSYDLYKSHSLTMLCLVCKMENILHDHMNMDETEFHLHGAIGNTTNPGIIHCRYAICIITEYGILYEPIYILWITHCQFHIRAVIGTDQKTFSTYNAINCGLTWCFNIFYATMPGHCSMVKMTVITYKYEICLIIGSESSTEKMPWDSLGRANYNRFSSEGNISKINFTLSFACISGGINNLAYFRENCIS